jgi:quercetin dioxygenase-like cupin family protein
MSCLQEAIHLVEQLKYQKDSIVSQELYSREIGTLTLFAFDEGQQLSEHTAPFDAFVLCVEGRVEVTIDGHAHQLNSSQLIMMPAHKPHALKALTPFKMLLIMFRSVQEK